MWDNILVLVHAPIFNVQLLIDGILVGSIFALAAYGMALVWGVMDIINIAQGEFVILGGFVTWWLTTHGVNPFLGIPISFVVLYVVGWIVYKIVICRVVDQDLFISILATFGISILLQQLMNLMFTADVQTVESGLGSFYLFGETVTVSEIKVVGFILVLVLGAALVAFMSKSKTGRAIRATAQNARAARIMGINTDNIYAITFSLNAAICGAAGALVVMTWNVQPFQGLAYTVRSFMIVIVAGIGNLPAVIVTGLGLGALENFAGFILGIEFQMAFIFSLLVVILVWRNHLLKKHRQVLR
ncbi:MAG: branched-chain amino acid ABC transporter permease [Rhodospirillaceae bacterium]|mgnify:CR=1 FL=1|jgi:branched-chain amino acid transport system permease protein|nr:branched-chain amino acid ABC transporter permease [Rhodospirillaceae bacterium]MBT4463762.1 branched-chain amino acid ABC transporter permease [Rhodospirillaceae bacterium]MBT5014201.1 branched-chain amino acid ABC transporter permease [Rhodospirillaceae bacterium]MBT5308613.1 branched-chain amino acid ABC transporter permease [Rhodospirillaceae bacterium]MBT6407625.1 branched-chain amino acid ABC transporter permease [Rhodospirillaceae bacterium]